MINSLNVAKNLQDTTCSPDLLFPQLPQETFSSSGTITSQKCGPLQIHAIMLTSDHAGCTIRKLLGCGGKSGQRMHRAENVMEMIIFIGLQGSGKSTFYQTHFAQTHVLISKDLFPNNKKPSRRQQQLIIEAFQAGHSVVIDNTNVSRESRAELIDVGREYGATIIGYSFEVQLEQSLARNKQRTGKAKVPDIAIFATRKRLVPPTYEEGFDQLYCVRSWDDYAFDVSVLKDEEM
jgi:predicted kinase